MLPYKYSNYTKEDLETVVSSEDTDFKDIIIARARALYMTQEQFTQAYPNKEYDKVAIISHYNSNRVPYLTKLIDGAMIVDTEPCPNALISQDDINYKMVEEVFPDSVRMKVIWAVKCALRTLTKEELRTFADISMTRTLTSFTY